MQKAPQRPYLVRPPDRQMRSQHTTGGVQKLGTPLSPFGKGGIKLASRRRRVSAGGRRPSECLFALTVIVTDSVRISIICSVDHGNSGVLHHTGPQPDAMRGFESFRLNLLFSRHVDQALTPGFLECLTEVMFCFGGLCCLWSWRTRSSF